MTVYLTPPNSMSATTATKSDVPIASCQETVGDAVFLRVTIVLCTWTASSSASIVWIVFVQRGGAKCVVPHSHSSRNVALVPYDFVGLVWWRNDTPVRAIVVVAVVTETSI